MALPSIRLGPVDQQVPVLGQGTWNMERDDRAGCLAALRRGIELGMTLIDTAELYGRGKAEAIVGEAIDGHRDDVFLVTKVLPTNASRDGTRKALERSLGHLGTDHVDLYLLHWTGPHPIADTMAAFQEIVDDGLARTVGVSNFELDELDAAQRAAGELPLVTDQIYYALKARACEAEVLPGLAKRDVSVMAYSPFGSGPLPRPSTAGGKALAAVAELHDATPHQVALAWTLRHDHVMSIPKASQVAHVEENVAAAELRLDADDLRRLDEAFPAPADAGLDFL